MFPHMYVSYCFQFFYPPWDTPNGKLNTTIYIWCTGQYHNHM